MRWSLFLLILVATFVVFANTQPPGESALSPSSASREVGQSKGLHQTEPQTASPTRLEVAKSPGKRQNDVGAMGTKGDGEIRDDEREKTITRGDQTTHEHVVMINPAAKASFDDIASPITPPKGRTITHTVRPGDTISSILERHNVYRSMARLTSDVKRSSRLFNLNPRDTIELVIEESRLLSLKRMPNITSYIIASLQNNRYVTREEVIPTDTRRAFAIGKVSDTFYSAGTNAGMSHKLILNAANILGWDIDFALDVRKGDSFVVVHDEEWLDGEKINDHEIIHIEYVNRGKVYRATRYKTADGKIGYYTPEGKNVKRQFIRTPLEFTRISSRYNPRRLHPILKVRRPHRGVDYAAPSGTPIYSTGDGKIIFRGKKGGYGNVVIVQHGHKYSTLYAHLSKFARGQRVGSRVRQKDTIGYVGSTGYATGPHLHYEFRVNGIHKNPLSVTLPDAQPLPRNEMRQFAATSQLAWEQLDTLGGHLLASE